MLDAPAAMRTALRGGPRQRVVVEELIRIHWMGRGNAGLTAEDVRPDSGPVIARISAAAAKSQVGGEQQVRITASPGAEIPQRYRFEPDRGMYLRSMRADTTASTGVLVQVSFTYTGTEADGFTAGPNLTTASLNNLVALLHADGVPDVSISMNRDADQSDPYNLSSPASVQAWASAVWALPAASPVVTVTLYDRSVLSPPDLLRATNGGHSVTVDGVNYLAGNYPVLQFDHPDFQAQGARDAVSLVVADANFAYREAFRARPPQALRLELGLLIHAEGVDDPLHLPYYPSGRLAAATCGLDDRRGQYCAMTFTGALDKLDGDAAMILTKDSQRQRDPDDEIFDALDLTGVEWKWVDDN